MKIYLVGGAVRDKLMGLDPKDLDYVVVLDKINNLTIDQGYKLMKMHLEEQGFKIHFEKEEMLTIKARFPVGHKFKGDADFVLARKEIGYTPNSRKPIVEIGCLEDDLLRRDFTVNAMAEDEEGDIYDPFNGRRDIANMILRTPLDPKLTFIDDPLRLLRALRFSVTKDFKIHFELFAAMLNPEILVKFNKTVSSDRIREEFMKMFKHDSVKAMRLIIEVNDKYCNGLLEACFDNGMRLEPTFKKI